MERHVWPTVLVLACMGNPVLQWKRASEVIVKQRGKRRSQQPYPGRATQSGTHLPLPLKSIQWWMFCNWMFWIGPIHVEKSISISTSWDAPRFRLNASSKVYIVPRIPPSRPWLSLFDQLRTFHPKKYGKKGGISISQKKNPMVEKLTTETNNMFFSFLNCEAII